MSLLTSTAVLALLAGSPAFAKAVPPARHASSTKAVVQKDLPAAEAASQVAQNAAPAQPAPVDAAAPAKTTSQKDEGGTAVEKVVVTARKRSERTLDVPNSVSTLNGNDLSNKQQFGFEDYVGMVPGLTTKTNGGFNQLTVRGLTTGTYTVNSSVATYVDETPYNVTGGLSAAIAPNVDAFDMQRIEILRGPQGTLYGANALGGILKFVTNAPDPTEFTSRVDAGLSMVDGGDADYNIHGMVNMPIADDAAVRFVLYDNRYPGFVDDTLQGKSNTNSSRNQGARGSLLFQPRQDISVRLSAEYQDRKWDDFSTIDVNPGSLAPINGRTQTNLVGNPGDVKNEIYNATVNWDLGFADLVSSSSYSKWDLSAGADVSNTFGVLLSTSVFPLFGIDVFPPFGVGIVPPYFQVFPPPYNYGLTIQQNYGMDAFTQELRLSSSGDGPLQWQVGGYFNDQSAIVAQDTFLVDIAAKKILTTSPFAPYDTGGFHNNQTYREYAGFANIDYKVSPTVDVGLGGRYSDNKQTFHEDGSGILGGDATTGANRIFDAPSSEGVFTWSGDARWHVTPKVMLYTRVATGFVPGGGNNLPSSPLTPPDIPRSYNSSTTTNYEVGMKGSFFEGHAVAELTVFQIDWKDIQINTSFGGVLTTLNGGGARSSGVEWNFIATPLDGLSLNFNGAYTDAHLTEALPAEGGQIGDRLPGAALWSSSLDASYERPISDGYSGFVGVDWRFSGSREADFTATGPRQKMPAYDIVDLRAGIIHDNLMLSVFVKNAADELAITSVVNKTLAGEFGPQTASILPPRTFGLVLSATY